MTRQPKEPVPDPNAESDLSSTMTAIVIGLAANALIPLLFDIESLSDRSHSMRAIVSVAGLAFAAVAFIASGAGRTPGLVWKCALAVLLSVLALPSVRWSVLSWGTAALVGLFAIPAVVKLMNRS